MRVLGIETSCDETGVALYDTEKGLIAEELFSQIDLHQVYGGVVPEIASRDHVRRVPALVRSVLKQAGLDADELDGIAYTRGPGLIGALLVGTCFGRAMAHALDIPAIGVHHLEGHLLAPLLEENRPEFPFLALLVSGGHTQLVAVEGMGQYEVLGESLDDAAGEAFDKTAKMLGLPYPGGPALAALAEQGDANRFAFPRPMTDRPGLAFSFSGLKTHTLVTWEKSDQTDTDRADIAACFQRAVVETLVIKCRRALKQTGMKRLVIAGGVGANRMLRQELEKACAKVGSEVFYPRIRWCTDNGAMIAVAGALRLAAGADPEGPSLEAVARWRLEDLPCVT